jgi:hypothetical protein
MAAIISTLRADPGCLTYVTGIAIICVAEATARDVSTIPFCIHRNPVRPLVDPGLGNG